MTSPARTAAYRGLWAVTSGRVDLPAALQASREQLVDERDRSLAAAIVTGTIRWQRQIDRLIEHFSKRTLARLDAEVVTVLRLSLYQILHLDRVPASAVVDDAVDLTRAARKPSAAGFVNAVLRSTLREKHRLPLPARPLNATDREAAVAYLGVTHSHPDWLVTRWLDRYGLDDAERWVRFNNAAAPLTLRINRLRTTRPAVVAALSADGIETEAARFAPDGLVVTSGNPLHRTADGTVFVQDEASQLIATVVDAHPGNRVLDLCASPGGKSIAMAADMEGTGRIIASDVRPKRLALLRDTVLASSARNIAVIRVAASGPLPFAAVFDRVLVDAPCSGLGTVRRDPDVKWRRHEADLRSLSRDQLALLTRAAAVLGKGGRLIYATCSSEPDENEQVVDEFLSREAVFARLDLRTAGPPLLAPFLDDRGDFRTSPSAHGLEAFYAAVLVRR